MHLFRGCHIYCDDFYLNCLIYLSFDKVTAAGSFFGGFLFFYMCLRNGGGEEEDCNRADD